MSLRTRLLLGLSVPVVLFGAAVFAVQQLILAPGFETLERETAARNLSRARYAIEKEVETLGNFCHDWSAWDDTYEFMADGNADYVAQNLIPETFANGNFDLCWIVALDGRVLFAEARDPLTNEPIEVRDFPRDAFPAVHRLLASRSLDESVDGLLQTSVGPMIVSCWPVSDSLQQAPMRGWLLMGRLVNAPRVAALAEQTHVDFRLLPAAGGLEPLDEDALLRLRAGATEVHAGRDEATRLAWCSLPAVTGDDAFLLAIEWPRDITLHGRNVLRFANLSLLAAAAITLLALAVLLQSIVVRPLAALTAHAVRVGRGDDLGVRLDSRRSDELGVLAREFDAMVAKLATSQEDLVDSARKGGRAEVASAVLHNVGNVLNSVTVSAAELRRRIEGGVLADLVRLQPLLAEHATDLPAWMERDARGRQLPALLGALAGEASTERAALLAETQNLGEGLSHVSDLVRAQQTHAGSVSPQQRVDLPEQVDCALRLSDDGVAGPPIEVVREFDEVPELLLPRHRLLEILVNLMRNARQSLRAASVEARRLAVRVVAQTGFVRVEVSDNGLGIAPEDIPRVFQQRFTTKPGGQGIGLHASANAALEMGGSLTARSEGPGRGATFVLDLPLRLPERRA